MSPEEYAKVKTIMDKWDISYKDQTRKRLDGPMGFGQSLELRPDYYAFTYVFQLKRKEIYDDGEDSKEEEETVKEEEEKKVEEQKIAVGEDITEEKQPVKPSNFYRTFNSERKSIIGKYRFLFLCQLMLSGFLAYEAMTDSEQLEALLEPADGVKIVLARFMCAIFLHITLVDETKQGLAMMKFAMNHPWKFRSWS